MTAEATRSTEPRAAALLWRHRRAGFHVVMLNIGFGEDGVEEHLRMLAARRHWLLAHPEDGVLIDTAGDIERGRAIGRLAVACTCPAPACRRRNTNAIALPWTSP